MSDKAEPIPIRAGVQPRFDAERELVDFMALKVEGHIRDFGEPPEDVALVLGSGKGRSVSSWTLCGDGDKAATCGAAAALLLVRAAGTG